MSYEDSCLGAKPVLGELGSAVSEEGFQFVPTTDASRWRPGLSYVWNLEDKNVRGALFLGLEVDYVKKRMLPLPKRWALRLRHGPMNWAVK